MARGFVVALLGAESTGKTTLAESLRGAWPARDVVVVPEFLREFCADAGRTPRADEQAAIAAEQTRRIEAAARAHELVIADTTALMIAVYSEHVFGDHSLYATALAEHARCDLTLLTALDLPWQADGIQRDGPQVRAPVDARVRAALARGGIGFGVVFGRGQIRTANAQAAIDRALTPPRIGPGGRWRWVCERCSDGDCERHRLLPLG